MKMPRYVLSLIILSALTWGCADTTSHSRAVYMLMDTSGTYSQQLDQAKTIINKLLISLQSGESLAVARIDSGSFSEKDIVAKVTFDQRPSVANQQKLKFKESIDMFIGGVRGSAHTDIKGAILQAVDYLDETQAAHKYIMIFSDLEEDLADGHIRNLDRITLDLTGYRVVALNVTKLGLDQVDPKRYYDRLDAWARIVKDRGGIWIKLNDIARLDRLLKPET
ncbi:MAG: VWA domain-containing protein [Proteobacteria bacterium]|nr:VWA domain-containing protein [Pseudomonadota bacterium]